MSDASEQTRLSDTPADSGKVGTYSSFDKVDDEDVTRLGSASEGRTKVSVEDDVTRLDPPSAGRTKGSVEDDATRVDPPSDGRPDNNGVTSSSNQSIPAVEDGGGSIFLPHNYQLGNYRIIKVLGRGGFGITYLAHELKLNREVVIKENLPSALSNRASTTYRVQPLTEGNAAGSYEWALRNFLNEARTLSSLEHPNIIRIFTAFEELGTAYYVMPHISGTSLDKVRYPMPEAEIRPILLAMLDALRYLHSRTPVLLHRDIKPANILRGPDGTPVLIDFGTARVLSEHSQTVVESPGYTPLEQMKTRGNVGPWTDLYALGGTMYKLITGKPPVRCLDRIGEDTQPRLADNTELLKNYSPRLLESIDKALALEVRNRWQSAEEWMKALADAEVTHKQPEAPRHARKQDPSGKSQRDANEKDKPEQTYREHQDVKKETGEVTDVKSPSKGRSSGSLIAWTFIILCSLILCFSQLRSCTDEKTQGVQDGSNASPIAVPSQPPVIDTKPPTVDQEGSEDIDTDAQFNLGMCHLEGRGTPKDDKKAFACFRKAAEQGHAAAQYRLSWMYEKGRGVSMDISQALSWCRKAAEQGFSPALYIMGRAYEIGRGVPQDASQAAEWYRKAAEQGDAAAQNNLAQMYANGRGVPKDNKKAVEWYEKAAEQGYSSAQNELGRMYEGGQGVPQDDSQAVEWYGKAAEQGYAAAQYNLGWMYRIDRGVPRDAAQAVAWFRKAADQEYAPALYELGVMYRDGRGVSKNDTQAVDWFRKAADQGYVPALYELGAMYQEGRGVAQDDAQAVAWFRMAAEQEFAAAQCVLGVMYQEGYGVPKNKSEAIKWFRKAAKQGNEYAKEELRRLGVEP